MGKWIAKAWIAVGAIVASNTATAFADLIAYEGFVYQDGASVDGQSGTSGAWNSNWENATNSATVASPGLTYSALPVSGNAASSATVGNNSSVNFRRIGPFNSGELWVSFLVQAEDAAAATGPSSFFGLSTYSGGTASANGRIAIQKLGDGSNTWGVRGLNGGVSADSSAGIQVAVGETYLLVTRFQFTDAGGQVDLYVNPPLGATPPAVSDAMLTETVAGTLDFDRIRVASQNGLNWLYDEIRLGETYADVAIPEPGSIILGCIAAVGFLGAYRRRRD